ncbi:hypothetical protein Tco_0651195 [Tanacetum coccineum]
MEIIPDEEEVIIDTILLVVKSPKIVDWKIHKEGKKSYYQIIRADGKSQMYKIFSQMIKSFDREDLEDLYKLVKVMSPPTCASRIKYHCGIAFATGLKHFTNPVMKLRMKHTNHKVRIPKDGEISKFPGYQSSEEEEEPKSNMNGWLIEGENEPLGYEASDKEVESDLESTTRSKPKCKKLKKIAKAIPNRTFCDCPFYPK